MAASRSDSNVLGTKDTFIARVQSSLLAAAIAIFSEGIGVNNHVFRVAFVHQILATPTSIANFTSMFALAVATDSTVLSDATTGGTVALDSNNIAAKQALVTDAHIDSAVSAMFNAFCQGIQA